MKKAIWTMIAAIFLYAIISIGVARFGKNVVDKAASRNDIIEKIVNKIN